MFILCNVHDRNYRAIYPDIPNVIFDISDAQLGNAKNDAWHAIVPGNIVCVVKSSRRISSFYRVEAKRKTEVKAEADGFRHVITGKVIGKLPQDQDMTFWLNKHKVTSQYLPANKFSIGFNVANLGDTLDSVELVTKNGQHTVREL
jgi:hypothetical protein